MQIALHLAVFVTAISSWRMFCLLTFKDFDGLESTESIDDFQVTLSWE